VSEKKSKDDEESSKKIKKPEKIKKTKRNDEEPIKKTKRNDEEPIKKTKGNDEEPIKKTKGNDEEPIKKIIKPEITKNKTKDWLIHTHDLNENFEKEENSLGNGHFGKVYQGIYKETVPVAIKTAFVQNTEDFEKFKKRC